MFYTVVQNGAGEKRGALIKQYATGKRKVIRNRAQRKRRSVTMTTM